MTENRAFQAIYLETGNDTCGTWREIQSRTGQENLADMESTGWEIWEVFDLPLSATSRRKRLST